MLVKKECCAVQVGSNKATNKAITKAKIMVLVQQSGYPSNKTNLVYLWRHWALETRLSQAERKQEQEQRQPVPTGCRERTNPEELEAD
jgi:hypothetical protein